MLATLGGALALVLGLAVLLLPLLLPELSRSRDALWGAVVLLLGLVLVTSAERLTGAPMLGVLCGTLLIGRLGVEVAQGRWRQLTPEERQRLWSAERWQKAVMEAASTAASLLQQASEWGAVIGAWLRERRQPRSTGKRWVRPEQPAAATPAIEAAAEAAAADTPAESATEVPVVVTSFEEIDALIEASEPEDSGEPQDADESSAGSAPPSDETAATEPAGDDTVAPDSSPDRTG